MRKNSVALIQHYYGKLPNYFPLWLKSAGFNKNFDFMIFTDIDFSGYKVPENVHVIHMTFDEMRARIAEHLDFKFECDTPYKACDYILMYGLIFRDYLEDYEFWGHVDPDIIWGDMSRFITPDILDKYDRIYRLGHLQFFRNTEKIRTFALHKLPGFEFSYRDVFRTKQHIAFEETGISRRLFSKFGDGGGGQYNSLDFADISPRFKQFTSCGNVIPAFRWKEGRLLGISLNGEAGNDKEYLYAHFQKRAMNFTPGLEDDDSFLIVPNEFVKDREPTEEEIADFIKPDAEYERRYLDKYSRKYRYGGIIGRIRIFLSMDKFEKKIWLCKYLARMQGKEM